MAASKVIRNILVLTAVMLLVMTASNEVNISHVIMFIFIGIVIGLNA
ncbi:hypothetical protein [Sporomusa aerivorans]